MLYLWAVTFEDLTMAEKTQQDRIEKTVNDILGKLYVDNGGESFQSKLNRHDMWIKRATRIGLAVAVAVFGLCIDTVQNIISAIIHGH